MIETFDEDKVSNRQRKKQAANIHNSSIEIAQNIMPIGQCTCNSDMFMYLKSEKENIYNIYCTGCELKRNFLKIENEKDIKLYFMPSQIMFELAKTYGEDVILETQERFINNPDS